MTWYVYNPQNNYVDVSAHRTLADGVFEAQMRGCTEDRPKRFMRGWYEIIGASGNQYYIISDAAAKRQDMDSLLCTAALDNK